MDLVLIDFEMVWEGKRGFILGLGLTFAGRDGFIFGFMICCVDWVEEGEVLIGGLCD